MDSVQNVQNKPHQHTQTPKVPAGNLQHTRVINIILQISNQENKILDKDAIEQSNRHQNGDDDQQFSSSFRFDESILKAQNLLVYKTPKQHLQDSPLSPLFLTLSNPKT